MFKRAMCQRVFRAAAWWVVVTQAILPVVTAPSSAQAMPIDPQTGLYYTHGRIYRPGQGRWLQREMAGTGLILVYPGAYHGQTPSIGVDFNPSDQQVDGSHLYQYVQGNPVNHTDPTGMFTYPELLARGAAYAGIGAAMMGGFYAGRGALRGYLDGASPRGIARAALGEAYEGMTSYEKMGGMLILSAIAATGPAGAVAVAGGGIGFGAAGYVDAQMGVADAQDFQELFLSTYDGYASSIGIGASAFALQASINTLGGPGFWRTSNGKMSDRSGAYQSKITGRPANEVYEANGVEFDGFKNGALLDAKGQRFEYLLGQKFGEGVLNKLIAQAQRQHEAAQGFRIEWHVAEKGAADALRTAFETKNISIKVIHTPP